MLTSELRFKFLDYFKKNSHEVVDSSPLIPANDETLLFTNAGKGKAWESVVTHVLLWGSLN